MDPKEKNCKLPARERDEKAAEEERMYKEREILFLFDERQQWDQIHALLPEPVWEKFCDGGRVVYEGDTVDHQAFGIGKVFREDGSLWLEGVFGLKGFLSGREYYPNGIIRFEGCYRLHTGYGPNYPKYGSWFGEDGKLIFCGVFHVVPGGVGWPHIVEPKGFVIPQDYLNKYGFGWETARKYIEKKKAKHLKLWMKNPCWREYYKTAPSEQCRKYIELEFIYSDHPSETILRKMNQAEETLAPEDWHHLYKYNGNNPRKKYIRDRIIQLRGELR